MATVKKPVEPVEPTKKAKSHEDRTLAALAKLDKDPDKRAKQLRKGTHCAGKVRWL